MSLSVRIASRRSASRAFLLGSVALLPILASGHAAAQSADPASAAGDSVLDEVTVTAERTPGTVNDSSSTVSVKKAKDLEQHNVKSPRDLVADEPGVNVGNQPTRGGSTNYVIRGIGENRVRLEIDGVEVPDYPTTQGGSAGLYSRDFIDFENLKQVEIVRGPASALYGSDAIGGVVSFITKDPEDFLNLTGKDWFMSLKTAYDSADKSLSETATVAGRAGAWSAMASYTRRDGQELDAHGALSPNPQDTATDNILAKLIYETPDSGRWRLTVERFRKSIDTNLRNSLSSSVTSYDTDDVNSRDRISLDWAKAVDTSIADELKAKIFWTRAQRTEENDRNVISGGVPYFRYIGGDFDQNIFGGEIQALKATDWFGLANRLTYGAQIDYTTTERLRTGYQTNLNTDTTSSVVLGETYPSKPFPDTKTIQAGIFAQDEIRLGALRVIPALRLDYYGLRADDDALYSGDAVSDMDKVALSPKLGVTYDLNETFRLVGQYAHGFRAPPYDSSNYGFTNSSYYYRIIANPDLKPETSDGFEAGIRAKFANGSSASFTGFYNLYRDFISVETVEAPSAGNGYMTTFQTVNLNKAHIWGLEAKGEWRFRPDWSAYGSLAYARGEDDDTGEAIDTVDPLTGVFGLRWRPTDQWSLESRVRAAAAKDRVSTDSYVKPGGYAVVDAMATFDYRPNLTVSAGVFNILDKSYFNAQDVVGVSATSSTLDLYRAPGRSFAISATVRW